MSMYPKQKCVVMLIVWVCKHRHFITSGEISNEFYLTVLCCIKTEIITINQRSKKSNPKHYEMCLWVMYSWIQYTVYDFFFFWSFLVCAHTMCFFSFNSVVFFDFYHTYSPYSKSSWSYHLNLYAINLCTVYRKI